MTKLPPSAPLHENSAYIVKRLIIVAFIFAQRASGEVTIYSIIDEYFANQKAKDTTLCMQMLSCEGVIEASRRHVRKNDKDALECIIE